MHALMSEISIHPSAPRAKALRRGRDRLLSGAALGLALLASACTPPQRAAGGPAGTAVAAADACVDIPEGYYYYDRAPDQFTPVTLVEGQTYRFENGAFVAAGGISLPPSGAGRAIASRIAAGFPALGFDWLGLDIKGTIATLTGTAPDADAKAAAFAAGEAAIRGDAEADALVTLVVDGISVEGGERGVGEALANLDERPTLESCQTAFNDTMEGRNIEFELNRATINARSARLLDALTGVAVLCAASGSVSIEIGGHTDSRGSDATNLALSQGRAGAVRDYLVSRGVPGAALTVVGYGETRPLDPAATEAAYARNRRTEFTLTRK
jgi:outer membrane protein OmpA-like peptidoglycan-associated protein